MIVANSTRRPLAGHAEPFEMRHRVTRCDCARLAPIHLNRPIDARPFQVLSTARHSQPPDVGLLPYASRLGPNPEKTSRASQNARSLRSICCTGKLDRL